MPRPSRVSQQEQQRGGGGNNDDDNDDEFIVNAVHGLSLGDAVRLKLVRGGSVEEGIPLFCLVVGPWFRTPNQSVGMLANILESRLTPNIS